MDRIDLLESKVAEMIGMIQRLHGENESLRAELSLANERAGSLSDERQVLDQERTVVRDRIEQLLGDIEGITGPTQGATAESQAAPTAPTEQAAPAWETAQAPEPTQTEPPQAAARTPEAPLPFRALTGGLGETGDAPETPEKTAVDTPVNPVLPGMS